MSLGIALKAFFAALGNRQTAEKISQVLTDKPAIAGPTESASEKQETKKAAPVEDSRPQRDHAITLLSTLQREARLVDLIKEDLEKYSDAQVGAAARPCLTQCAGVLDRLLGLEPLLVATEGEVVDVDADASPSRFQWIGEGAASATQSTQAKLVHHGWQATKVAIPTWTGADADATVVAAAQVKAP